MRSLAEVLSDDNRALLKVIQDSKPQSISSLADITGRKPEQARSSDREGNGLSYRCLTRINGVPITHAPVNDRVRGGGSPGDGVSNS
eukprot:gene26982-33636_t